MDNERSSVCDNKMTKYNSTSSDSQIGIVQNANELKFHKIRASQRSLNQKLANGAAQGISRLSQAEIKDMVKSQQGNRIGKKVIGNNKHTIGDVSECERDATQESRVPFNFSIDQNLKEQINQIYDQNTAYKFFGNRNNNRRVKLNANNKP